MCRGPGPCKSFSPHPCHIRATLPPHTRHTLTTWRHALVLARAQAGASQQLDCELTVQRKLKSQMQQLLHNETKAFASDEALSDQVLSTATSRESEAEQRQRPTRCLTRAS